MEHKIIAIYCLIDEMLKGLHVKNDIRAKTPMLRYSLWRI